MTWTIAQILVILTNFSSCSSMCMKVDRRPSFNKPAWRESVCVCVCVCEREREREREREGGGEGERGTRLNGQCDIIFEVTMVFSLVSQGIDKP